MDDLSHQIGQCFTVVIPAYNEELRLPVLLESLSSVKNVLLVDNYSTDRTREIAVEFDREVIQVSNQGGFVECPEWMKPVWAYIKTEYILLMTCAEYAPQALLREYDRISGEGIIEVVRTRRVSITAGLPIAIDLPPKWLSFRYKGEVRFFKRNAVSYVGNTVHSKGHLVCSRDRILLLPQERQLMLYQFRNYDSSETEQKHRVYNDVLAEQVAKIGGQRSYLRAWFHAFWVFFQCYIIFGNIRHGMLGFMNAYARFHMELGLIFRRYEWEHGFRKNDILIIHNDMRREWIRSKF